MASTSTHLERGYEKIARWLAFEFRQLGRDAALEVTPMMSEAVRRLNGRPELLTQAALYILSALTDFLQGMPHTALADAPGGAVGRFPRRAHARHAAPDRAARARPDALHGRHACMDPPGGCG